MFDIITVIHNKTNSILAYNKLLPSLKQYANYPYNFIVRDNTNDNIGFSRACNESARSSSNKIIGFVNPDAWIDDFFMDLVLDTLVDDVVITGCHYGKNPAEIHSWGLQNWVCGASMFVTREWFDAMGGFDERFFWSHEETDFIRTTEKMGKICKSYSEAEFRIVHSSPASDSSADTAFKQTWFANAAQEYHKKWA